MHYKPDTTAMTSALAESPPSDGATLTDCARCRALARALDHAIRIGYVFAAGRGVYPYSTDLVNRINERIRGEDGSVAVVEAAVQV